VIIILDPFGMSIKLKDSFIPFILFLSGVTAQFPIEIVHSFVTYSFALYCLAILILKIYKGEFVFNKFLLIWILLWLIWVVLTCILSKYHSQIIIPLIRTFLFFIVILATYQFVDNNHRIEGIFTSFKWIGIILSASVILEFLFSGCQLFDEKGFLIRYTGLYSGENAAGYVMSVGIATSLYSWIKKKVNFATILFIFFGLLLTGSRSAMIIVFGISFFMFVGKTMARKVFLIAISVLSGIILLFLVNFNLISRLLRFERGNAGRTELWETAIRIINDSPVYGCGISCLPIEMYKYLGGNKRNSFEMARLNDAHNLFLTVTAELGYIGLFLLVILLAYMSIYVTKKNNIIRQIEKYNIFRFFLAFFLAFLIRAMFEGNGIVTKGWIGIDIYMWVFFIIALRMQQISNENTNN
jgi:O-antigen ligase